MKKVCVCFAHVITTHISPSSLMFHPSLSAPSLLFPHGRPDCTAVSDVLSDECHPKIAGQAHSDKGEDEFGYLAKYRQFTGSEPKQSDNMATADDDATPINDPEQDSISDSPKKPHTTTLDGSLFLQCVKPLSRQFFEVTLIFRKTAQKACLTRETEDKQRMLVDRDGSVISVGESMSRKSRRNSTRSHSHQTLRDFYFGERDLREHLERRIQQAIRGENFSSENVSRLSTKWKSRTSNEEIQKMHHLSHKESFESRRQQWMMANHSEDHAQRERTHLCSELEMRSHLRQESYARSCQEIEELKRRCYQEENAAKKTGSRKNSIRNRIRSGSKVARTIKNLLKIQ